MKLTYFFRISWAIQLAVGLGLFVVSFLIQSAVLKSFIAASLLAVLLAAALEAGKAVAIIWHRYLNSHQASSRLYPQSTKLASATFRLGLVGLSALCSLLFLANNLDRPHLESVKAQDLKVLEQHQQQELSNLEATVKQRRDALKNSQAEEYERLQENFGSRVAFLEADLKAEMDNVVKGTFKGPRYEEINTQLQEAQRRRDSELTKLTITHNRQSTLLEKELQAYEATKRAEIISSTDAEREVVMNSDYAEDDRANDSKIVAFLKMSQSVFNFDLLPLQFVFAFSLLLSILMELGIMLAFETITVAILPALSTQHEEAVKSTVLDSQLNGEMERDSSRHEASMSKVKNAAERVIEKAQEYMSVTHER